MQRTLYYALQNRWEYNEAIEPLYGIMELFLKSTIIYETKNNTIFFVEILSPRRGYGTLPW